MARAIYWYMALRIQNGAEVECLVNCGSKAAYWSVCLLTPYSGKQSRPQCANWRELVYFKKVFIVPDYSKMPNLTIHDGEYRITPSYLWLFR